MIQPFWRDQGAGRSGGEIMRMLSCLVFATMLTAAALAANQAGTVPAAEGSIQITPIMRASVQIEYAGKIIHVDPMGKNDYTQAKPADLILVTDIDADNLDPDQIARIRKPGA